jgi:hypothetical protein
MQVKRGLLTRRLIVSAALVFAPLSVLAFNSNDASAAQLLNRSLTLQAGATDGGSLAGGTVNHQFQFDIPSTTSLGSIEFRYCTTAGLGAVNCVTPTGLDTTGASLGSEAGSDVTGFSINNTTNGAPYLTRTAAAPAANDTAILRIDSVVNPTTVNESFFVRISTFTSVDTTGSPIDQGTVTASTAEPIIVSGTMPESLIFCTGEEISTTSGIPDCNTATAGAIEFDQLFSPTDTATTRSQMSASTNAGFGYVITVNGTTLTSGANEIDAMATATTGVRGSGQFGLNLVENTVTTSTVPVGLNVAPTPDADDLRGEPTTDYAIPDTFKFLTGDTVASSTNGGLGPTNAQIFTVSYIVNVPGNQPAGTYTTTLTYICTPTF